MLFHSELCALIHPVSEIVFCHHTTFRILPLCALTSVLNHCEVYHIAAVVYQCYSDITGLDSVTMEAYKPVLAKLGKNIQVRWVLAALQNTKSSLWLFNLSVED